MDFLSSASSDISNLSEWTKSSFGSLGFVICYGEVHVSF